MECHRASTYKVNFVAVTRRTLLYAAVQSVTTVMTRPADRLRMNGGAQLPLSRHSNAP